MLTLFYHRLRNSFTPMRIAGIFLALFFALTAITSAYSATSGMSFLIQNKWGGIHGVSLNADLNPSQPAMVRRNVDNAQYPTIVDLDAFTNGGYQLTALGTILPIGKARLPYAAWAPIRDATALTMASEEGGWIASGATIKTIGHPPKIVLPTLNSKSIISDMEYDPQRQRLALIIRDGTIALCDRDRSRILGGPSLKKDRAIDIEFSPDGFWILTETGRVYSWNRDEITLLKDVPDLDKGLACDLESSPTGEGFYILDIFGVVHACGGAPQVPTEPLTQPVAVDLEIIREAVLPTWDPPGLHTQVSWGSTTVLLDPHGPSKPVSLIVDRAEDMTVFWAQIQYDPKRVSLDPNSVRVGSWWDKGLRDSRINPVVDAKNGVMTLQGSGVHFPYEGASGGGELVRFAVAPVEGVTEAVTALQVEEFYFRDAYLSNVDHSSPVINSCTVHIAPIQPRLNASWRRNKEWLEYAIPTTKPGDILQADILIENGSRISGFEFGFQFSNTTLRYLGATPGNVWRPEIDIQTSFDMPLKANRSGFIERQSVTTIKSGACMDRNEAIVSLFFATISPGQGEIRFKDIVGKDQQGTILDIEMGKTELSVVCE